ncbi:MAG: Glutathione S-transferase, N-terminal domain [Bradyrhizobium sp.]|nr:Glutathione S-transferase, N-terminal domain [Bradyrhizobium sp.]
MKLHQMRRGTNPRRVIIYLAEKGIDVPRVEVDGAAREHKTAAFLAMNPAGKVPVLELDDGRAISESAAIVEFLEELHPAPPMIGANPVQRARVRAVERIASDLIARTQIWLMHANVHFAARVQQDPAVAAAVKPLVDDLLDLIEAHIGDEPFVAGHRVTIADCTLFALFQTCRELIDVPLGAGRPRLDAWYARFAERPSAAY